MLVLKQPFDGLCTSILLGWNIIKNDQVLKFLNDISYELLLSIF